MALKISEEAVWNTMQDIKAEKKKNKRKKKNKKKKQD